MQARSLIVVAAVLSGTFVSAPAHALLIKNYSGSNVNMGNVVVSQQGTISDIYHLFGGFDDDINGKSIVKGDLPKMSQITFSYTLTGIDSATAQSTINYDYHLNHNHYKGFSTDNTDTGLNQIGYVNGHAGVSQVFATANLTLGKNDTATVTTHLFNYTAGYQDFMSQLTAVLDTESHLLKGTGTITYAVSSIPLPASLPMMLTGLAGLFGFARRQRKTITA